MESSEIARREKEDLRLHRAVAWLKQIGGDYQTDLHPIAGDASFRRYFRLLTNDTSRILMDAPPPGEDVRPFIDINHRLRTAGLHAPEIFHADTHNGFLLLEDFGDDLYRDVLTKNNSDTYFPGLFDVLKTMAQAVDASGLPEIDTQALRLDLDLFFDWYLGHHRKAVSFREFDQAWDEFCGHLIDSALEQPQCFIHRDFHSCNLLRIDSNDIGIIDFQDASRGPVSYDLISILWDRYISWPRVQLEIWIEEFRLALGLEINTRQWLRYCDLMALQRNFKIVGIFARLHYRDEKDGYIEMIPRFYQYLLETLQHYPEFKRVLHLLEQVECVP